MLKPKFQQLASKNNRAGFTIIESLVAVIVLGILMTAIAPTIVLSTATRVQSRRVELATQAARAYIDGVSAGNIPAPPISTTSSVAVPGTNLSCANPATDKGYCSLPKDDSSYKVFCVDGTGDGICTDEESKDLIVQAFGFNQNSTEASQGYRLSVRVYRADAFQGSEALIRNENDNGEKVTQSTFTGGLGKRKAPLVEMTTEIVTDQTTFEHFCARLKVSDADADADSQCSN
ncbi:MAG: hormogonium polysaccharide secretion pseudopilin HpsB [Rivularia sp. (in: cyanobacteria)]|jgi:prepilin-type N-terminal cleavage/methylation domain-containing protein